MKHEPATKGKKARRAIRPVEGKSSHHRSDPQRNGVRGVGRKHTPQTRTHKEGGPELPLGTAPGVAPVDIPSDVGTSPAKLRITVALTDDVLELYKVYRASHLHLNPPDSLLVGALIARGLVSFFRATAQASKVLNAAGKTSLGALEQTLKR